MWRVFPTPEFEVAKWSCRLSVIRSSSWLCDRTILSSHHSVSCPHALAGAIGLPFAFGAGPESFAGDRGASRFSMAPFRPSDR